jgi:guanylate kinase
MTEIKRRGLMLVLSSPSGAGKTTLSRRLLAANELLEMSVSATTRRPRANEVAGRDYFFISNEEFQTRIERAEFLEHARVFGHWYGTPKQAVLDVLERGRDVLFDIDWQGTQQLRQMARGDLVSVFILPPSHDELERRLRTRAQDTEEEVQKRMAKAADEISHWPEYDYVIVNHDLGSAQQQLQAILEAERLRRSRLLGVPDFVRQLIGGS